MNLKEREISNYEQKLFKVLSPISEVGSVIKRIREKAHFFTARELLCKVGVDCEKLSSDIKDVLDKKVTQICRASSRFTKNCICVELYDDGEKTAKWAMEQGALFCITSKKYSGIPCIVVENTVEIYSKLCRVFREFSAADVTAVVGSIGKTTTKRMIDSVYKTHYNTYCDPENENQIDCVGYIVQHIPKNTEIIVQEISEDTPGCINWISNIILPKIIVVTCIDMSHIEQFGNAEGIINEISDIQNYADSENAVYVINLDDNNAKELFKDKKRVTVSLTNKNADLYSENVRLSEQGLSFDIVIKESCEKHCVMLDNIFAEHNVYSALQAFAAGLISGVPVDKIINGLKRYKTVGKRQNVFKTKNNITVYADCYNAVAKSIESAVDGAMRIPLQSDVKRVAVLGDIEEAGEYSKEIHREVVRRVRLSGMDLLICYGPKMTEAVTCGESMSDEGCQVVTFDTKEAISEYLKKEMKSGDLILFKASRKSALEDIIAKVWPGDYRKQMVEYKLPILKWRIKTLLS